MEENATDTALACACRLLRRSAIATFSSQQWFSLPEANLVAANAPKIVGNYRDGTHQAPRREQAQRRWALICIAFAKTA